MKSSQILASVLFGSFVAAAPFKRDLVTKTELVVETVVVYTTVWDDETPVAEATTTAGGYFYEQPAASSVAVETTPAAPAPPAYTPPAAVQEPSSIYTPPVETPSPAPAPVVQASSAPVAEAVETPTPAPAAPTVTEAAYTPAPVVSSAAPAATSAAAAPSTGESTSKSTGESYTGDVTIYYNTGAFGACGTALHDDDMVVALAQPAWGSSTYDVMTGEATNPWCGQKINVEANGKTITATIMDMCPGCTGHDIDLSKAAWSALGMTEDTRITGSWSKAS